MKQGAYHYAHKPFNVDEIAMLVEKALETTTLRREVRSLRALQSQPYTLDRIIGSDDAMVKMRALLRRVAIRAGVDRASLTGERGTGN